MRRVFWWSLLGVLFFVSLGSADLVMQRPRADKEKVPSLSLRSYTDAFVGQKRALAVAYGNGTSCLGMYVFDAYGNCVAKRDVTAPETADDVAVDWIPPETARYDVQIRNAGIEVNTFEIALR